jgi:SAM-dependent methyltransferase
MPGAEETYRGLARRSSALTSASRQGTLRLSKNPAKDFGPIADDYAFFEAHATEAEQDARAYVERLAPTVPAEGPIRLFDFGCGSGTFTARFLQQANWPAARLQLTLVEPVESTRRQAVARLAPFSGHPIADSATLPEGTNGRFDVVLSNHVLYYVRDLKSQLAALIDALSPTGVFVTAIAARDNALIEFWTNAFRLLGREIPYHISEDVEAALQQLGATYQKQAIAYELAFPDTHENRMRILRFLLADYLPQLPDRPLLNLFDRHANAAQIKIGTSCDHVTISARRQSS